MTVAWEEPDWSAPAIVRAAFTLRGGGFSSPPFDGLNLANHVGDDVESVLFNRRKLVSALSLPAEPVWMNQVHSEQVIEVTSQAVPPVNADGSLLPAADGSLSGTADGSLLPTADGSLSGTADGSLLPTADGSYTREPGVVLAVFVADCLPIILASESGDEIAVLHAGWRGLASGIVAQGAARFSSPATYAWVGPGIGPCHYEVGSDVRRQFADYDSAFSAGRDEDHWMLDIKQIALAELQSQGIRDISVGDRCTYCDPGRYYSARRDAECGRMAALVWIG